MVVDRKFSNNGPDGPGGPYAWSTSVKVPGYYSWLALHDLDPTAGTDSLDPANAHDRLARMAQVLIEDYAAHRVHMERETPRGVIDRDEAPMGVLSTADTLQAFLEGNELPEEAIIDAMASLMVVRDYIATLPNPTPPGQDPEDKVTSDPETVRDSWEGQL
ncbi:MAG: hypothetical protein ABI360_01595 [Allobranchiibius sp.]